MLIIIWKLRKSLHNMIDTYDYIFCTLEHINTNSHLNYILKTPIVLFEMPTFRHQSITIISNF